MFLIIGEVEAARRPRYGGTLRMELRASIGTTDPSDVPADSKEQAAKSAILANVFENLVRLDDKGDPQPQLAVFWTHDTVRKRWVFSPRPGVRFHNGTTWDPPGGSITVDDRRPIENILRDLAVRQMQSQFARRTGRSKERDHSGSPRGIRRKAWSCRRTRNTGAVALSWIAWK